MKRTGERLRITVKEQFLVLHNQIVSVNIVRCGSLLCQLTVYHLALFIHGEVTCVGSGRLDGFQILNVLVLADGKLEVLDNIGVFFLKHFYVDTVTRLSDCIVHLVLGNLVNEEQGKHLDAFVEQLALTLNVR